MLLNFGRISALYLFLCFQLFRFSFFVFHFCSFCFVSTFPISFSTVFSVVSPHKHSMRYYSTKNMLYIFREFDTITEQLPFDRSVRMRGKTVNGFHCTAESAK